MSSPTDDAVLVERDGHVLVVTLHRPAARNAVDAEVSGRLGAALETAEHDPDIRAVVLTGAGEQAFCAGADLKALGRGEDIGAPGHPEWGFAGFVTHPIGTPIVAGVNGSALGGGTELALACDLVVAARSARFGLPEVTRGIVAAAGGLVRLPRQLPRKVAMRMILTGEPITATEAAQWGLVNEVVDDGTARAAALDLARRVAANAPLAVRASKRVATGIVDDRVPDEDAAWAAGHAAIGELIGTEDAREGIAAFAQKRPPRWRAR